MKSNSTIHVHKGRGAVSNLQGRFEIQSYENFDDGWSDSASQEYSSYKTLVIHETAKSILNRNGSPDIPFNVSLNPYRGCEHGCIYCFARPTHSYLGLSPGLDFERQIFAKINAPELLVHEISKPTYQPESVALGVATDAYQPCERSLQLTRRVLQIMHDCEHPLALITKSSLIERDIDLLTAMAAKNQAVVAVTLTTLDHDLARILEPRATAPQRRLRTIRTLSEAGIPVAVSIAPVIPFITDQDLEHILDAAAQAGAVSASYIVLRLPWEVRPLFKQWLETHFPERAQRVMARISDIHGGKEYDAQFGQRMHGQGIWANLIQQRFLKAMQRIGLGKENNRRKRFSQLDGSKFTPPISKLPARQLDLFF